MAALFSCAGRWLRFLAGSMESLIFPFVCRCCDGPLADGEPAFCQTCRATRFESPDILGGDFREVLPWYMLFRISLWRFDHSGHLRGLVHRLKYGGDRSIGLDFGLTLGRRVRSRSADLGLEMLFDPVLVPVPLHVARLRSRGFNQAAVIARGVSQVTGWPVLADRKLIRRRDTASQTGYDPGSRRRNLEGVFVADDLQLLPEELPVIIDDVYTTGATVDALAGVLRNTGAQQLAAATVAEA